MPPAAALSPQTDAPEAVVVSFAELMPEVTLRPLARANLSGIGG